MRRSFLIFLLLLLPYQLAWSAAAIYCANESTDAPAHFGHHAHSQAAVKADKDRDAEKPGKLKLGAECHTCHAQPAGMAVEFFDVTATVGRYSIADSPPPSPYSIAAARPHRPNWIVSA